MEEKIIVDNDGREYHFEGCDLSTIWEHINKDRKQKLADLAIKLFVEQEKEARID